jgi:hypothetical protein
MKRILAGYLSWLLAFLSAPFFPTPAYAVAVATQLEANCLSDLTLWTPRTAKAYAKALIKWDYPHWNKSEWTALEKLWTKESNWRHQADNKESTAGGIPQILGLDPKSPAPYQIERGLAYIQHRYERPSIAWAHWRANGWY